MEKRVMMSGGFVGWVVDWGTCWCVCVMREKLVYLLLILF